MKRECTIAYATEVAPRFLHVHDPRTVAQPSMTSEIGTRPLGGNMKPRRSDTKQLAENHATATAKVRLWESRAVKARQNGRKADAGRCEDKVRDWASKARQAERTQNSEE